MYINSRIIQTKQNRFFPFFSFFVNKYDIIRILITESYKKSCFPLPPRYDIIWNSQIMALYLTYIIYNINDDELA